MRGAEGRVVAAHAQADEPDPVGPDPGAVLKGVISLFPADSPLPPGAGIRSIPLVARTPLYAWSLLWRGTPGHPRLGALLRGFAEVGSGNRWLEYVPGRDWLPDVDQARVRHPGEGDAR